MRNIIDEQKIVLAGGFFSKEQIASILEKAKALNFESTGTIIDGKGKVTVDKKVRNSSNVVVLNDSEIAKEIYKGLELLSEGIYGHKDNIKFLVEAIDIVKYEKGQRVTEHLDAFANSDFVGQNREYSVMIGLQTADIGGDTVFTVLGETHNVKAGQVLIWRNLDSDGKPDRNMVHKGTEVEKGVKYIAILFIKQQKK